MQPMLSTESGFTPLECAVLDAICSKQGTERTAFEAQLSAATVLRRENTGAGFCTYLSVERSSNAPLGGERHRRGPAVQIDGLKHGMGFVLWLKEGYADCLEGYCYDERTTGIAFEQVPFELLQP